MDTKEFKLPSGKAVVIRTYTTRRDDREVQEIINSGMKVTSTGGKETIDIDPVAIMGSQHRYVELLTKSIDGKTEDISVLLDELRSADYKALSDEVAKITKATDPKDESKS